jgi:flavin-dependent dehydrogenase
MRIAANIQPAEARETCWDALVIGAGPAGALAARQLAAAGLQILLVDRKPFPRSKVCGCCLNPRTIATLRQVGLGGLLASHGATPLERFVLRSAGREVALPLPGGLALSREVLDAALVRAAIAARARFLPETSAAVLPAIPLGDSRLVRLTAADHRSYDVAARVVLAADGLGRSSLPPREFASRIHPRAKIGLGAIVADGSPNYTAGVIYMAVGRHGYAGLVRLEDGRLNVAAAVHPAFVKRCGGPGAAVANLIETAGFAVPTSLVTAAWHGTVELTRHTPRPAGHRVLLLGDAAGYVEPFTGEGIAWALAAAAAAPPLVQRGLPHWDESIEADWLKLRRRLVERRQAWCRGAAWLLRRPRLVQATMQLLKWFPALARPVVRRLSAPDVLSPAGGL